MAVLVIIFSVFITVVQNTNGQECPGITKDFVNVIGTVGTDTSMVMEACQSLKNPEYVAFSSSSKRIWTSEFPDQIEGPYDVKYPHNFSLKAPYEFIFIGSEMNRAGKHEASFLLGLTPPKTSAVFVAVNSMAKGNTCPEENQKKTAGDEIVMVCEVEFKSDGIIFPKLAWEDIDSNDTHHLGNDTHNGKVRSEARFIASAETDKHIFTCKLRFDDDPDFNDSCTTFYDVQYRVSRIDISPDPDFFPGGILALEVGDVIICSANGNPSPWYYWTCGENIIEGSDLTVIEEYQPQMNCTCTAQNTINGVNSGMERIVAFSIGAGGGSVEPSTGKSAGWKIAVGIMVPLVVIGIFVGVILYWTKLRKKSPKELPPENGITSSEKPGHDNRNFQGSNLNVQPNVLPGHTAMIQSPQYGNMTQQGYPGKGSPGYADLGVKHLGGSLPGSTSTINSIPDQHTAVSKDPSGGHSQGVVKKGGDTSV